MKKITLLISTILIVVLVVGGLGYVTKGFANWDYQEAYTYLLDKLGLAVEQPVIDDPIDDPIEDHVDDPIDDPIEDPVDDPIDDPVIGTAVLPLTLTRADFTINEPGNYYKAFEGTFNLSELDSLSIYINIPSQSYVRIFDCSYVSAGDVSYYYYLISNTFIIKIEDNAVINKVGHFENVSIVQIIHQDSLLPSDFTITFNS